MRIGRRDGRRYGSRRARRCGSWCATDVPSSQGAASLEDAVQTLDAECGAVAAWLAAGPARVRLHQLVLPPLAAMLRAMAAPGGSARPWARWVAAVFAGYRALLVPAKVWEVRQRAAIAPVLAGDPVRRAEA